MRILQVNKFFYEKGGTERYLFGLSAALALRGHQVVHFSMQHPRNLPSDDAPFFVRERHYDGGATSVRAGIDFIRSKEAAQQM